MTRQWIAFAAAAAAMVLAHAGLADAVVSCRLGCSKSSAACLINLKLNSIGCQVHCREELDADLMFDYDGCRADCDALVFEPGRSDCQADGDACDLACENASNTNVSCANVCGEDLFNCAAPIVLTGQSSFAVAAAAFPQVSGDFLTPGAQGVTDLDACYSTPNTGFDDCIATLGCGSVCGSNGVEAGEECDDGGNANGDGCSAECYYEDSDRDGIRDDGSNSSVVGDALCPNGVTANCDDNCIGEENPGQQDADGDGYGDACDTNCASTATGSTISGTVYGGSVAPANVIAGASLAACQPGTICCAYATTDAFGQYSFSFLDDGSYDISVFPPGTFLPGFSAAPIPVSGGSSVSGTDFVLQGPQPLPANVTITNNHVDFGVPFVQFTNDVTLTVQACIGAAVTYSATQGAATVSSGPLLDGNADGTFEVVITNLSASLLSGYPSVQFTITITGCGGAPDGVSSFDAYIDPSGFTLYLTGDAAVGATVTLLKGETSSGPFEVVPDGSAIMSPNNRTNPDTSDGTGHYGWDVLAGWYKVTAEISGCTVESPVLTIPPAVTDLDLTFECPCVAGPWTGCRSAGKGQLTIKDNVDDTTDSFGWKWSDGEDTSYGDLGLPLSSTAYDVCVFSGSGNDELTRYFLPKTAGWAYSGATGYKFKDSEGIFTGLTKGGLKSGTGGGAKLQLKGKGERLPDPVLGGLPLPITIQLQPSDLGVCFESVFGADDVSDNESGLLRLKLP